MAKIPALVWLIIGGIVAYVSLRAGDSFTFFFYIGLIFLGIGVAKLVIGFLLRPKESKAEQKAVRETPSWRLCPRCRSPTRNLDFFCWKCGQKLR